mmetsp:Transcript_11373/g.26477  ORF Transcript_11373/g.26477 Transcript_11373/m.26477 type:complete len:312 (-) Transcript_11373:1049-1984(-)
MCRVFRCTSRSLLLRQCNARLLCSAHALHRILLPTPCRQRVRPRLCRRHRTPLLLHLRLCRLHRFVELPKPLVRLPILRLGSPQLPLHSHNLCTRPFRLRLPLCLPHLALGLAQLPSLRHHRLPCGLLPRFPFPLRRLRLRKHVDRRRKLLGQRRLRTYRLSKCRAFLGPSHRPLHLLHLCQPRLHHDRRCTLRRLRRLRLRMAPTMLRHRRLELPRRLGFLRACLSSLLVRPCARHSCSSLSKCLQLLLHHLLRSPLSRLRFRNRLLRPLVLVQRPPCLSRCPCLLHTRLCYLQLCLTLHHSHPCVTQLP